MDGFHVPNGTVFQFHGCYYHGCLNCYPDQQTRLVDGKTAAQLLQETRAQRKQLRDARFMVVEKWDCAFREPRTITPQPFTKPYPCAVFFDSEAFGDKNWWKEPTEALTYESAHVPISASIGDTHEPDPTHICERTT